MPSYSTQSLFWENPSGNTVNSCISVNLNLKKRRKGSMEVVLVHLKFQTRDDVWFQFFLDKKSLIWTSFPYQKREMGGGGGGHIFSKFICFFRCSCKTVDIRKLIHGTKIDAFAEINEGFLWNNKGLKLKLKRMTSGWKEYGLRYQSWYVKGVSNLT